MSDYFIKITSFNQRLSLYLNEKCISYYSISTAKNGLGEDQDSEKTPRGCHEIVEKIGEGKPLNTVFVSRESTGEIYTPELKKTFPDRDWILTRILRLKGTEPGRNSGDGCDSFERYIYIHGTPNETQLGVIGSRGCIRMNNEDIVTLCDKVPIGTPVFIE
jgi:lipoprotein-anchoring transpeptidase ErfK/SrfK